MKKVILLSIIFAVFSCIIYSYAEELTLKTILPRQDELRGTCGAVGTTPDSTYAGAWSYEDVSLNNGWFKVAKSIWIGPVYNPSVNAELYIKENPGETSTGAFADNTHPRITMEDRNGLIYLQEMDAQNGNNLHLYYPCDQSLPNEGMYMSVAPDQVVRFFSSVFINEVAGGLDNVAALTIGYDNAVTHRRLAVNGDTQTTSLVLTPVNPSTITATAGRAVNGMIITDNTDNNRLKQYDATNSVWKDPVAEATVNGTYMGDGAASKLVTLGFKPKYLQIVANVGTGVDVAIFTKYNTMLSNPTNASTTNFAVVSGVGVVDQWRGGCIEITNTGFRVYKGTYGAATRDPNISGEEYHYIVQR